MGIQIPGITSSGPPPDHLAGRPESEARVTLPRREDRSASQEEMGRSIQALQEALRLFNRRLKFSVNEEINRVVVKVIDGATDKVIKEIPPEEIQRLVARLKETLGLLFDETI